MTDALRLLAKADRAIAAGHRERAAGDAEFAVNRAYYAMFYAADAVLRAAGMRFASHGAVHAAFGRDFVRAGRLDVSLHRMLLDAYAARQRGDYDAGGREVLDDGDAAEHLENAERFVAGCRGYVERGGA